MHDMRAPFVAQQAGFAGGSTYQSTISIGPMKIETSGPNAGKVLMISVGAAAAVATILYWTLRAERQRLEAEAQKARQVEEVRLKFERVFEPFRAVAA